MLSAVLQDGGGLSVYVQATSTSHRLICWKHFEHQPVILHKQKCFRFEAVPFSTLSLSKRKWSCILKTDDSVTAAAELLSLLFVLRHILSRWTWGRMNISFPLSIHKSVLGLILSLSSIYKHFNICKGHASNRAECLGRWYSGQVQWYPHAYWFGRRLWIWQNILPITYTNNQSQQ